MLRHLEVKINAKPKSIRPLVIKPPSISIPIHPIVYYGNASHLGDRWIKMCKIINVSITTNSIVRFIESMSDYNNKYNEIVSLLEPSLLSIISKNDAPKGTEVIDTWHLPNVYVPTRIRWSRGVKMNRICYQFDGRSYYSKNPPVSDLSKLTDFIPNVDFVRLGNHLSLEKCVKIMASSDCFLGIDSGMSHIAHSVGVPCFIIKYRFNFLRFHKNAPPFKICHGTDDAISKVTNFMENLWLNI